MKNRFCKIFIILILTVMIADTLSGCSAKKPRSLKLTGTVEADSIDISSELSGKLTDIKFNEGDSIKKGDIAACMDTSSLMIQKKQSEEQVESLNSKLRDIKAGSRQEQINQAQADVEAIQANIDGQVKVLDELNGIKADMQKLYEETSDPSKKQEIKSQMDDTDIKILSEESSINVLDAQRDAAKEQYELLKKGNTANAIDSSAAAVEEARSSLDMINLQLEKSNIKSPSDGTVIYKAANVGQVVNPGTPILTIADLSILWVKFYIPEKELDRINLGQEVKVVSDSNNGNTCGGKITYISSEGEFTPKNVETKEDGSNVYYAFKVKLNGVSDKLKPGMMVDVEIE